MGYDKQRYPTSIKTLCHWVFSCSSFLKLCSCWWKRQMDITNTWSHWTKDGPHCLTWQFRKWVCFWQLLCVWGTRLLLNTGTVLRDLLRKHFETRHSIIYIFFYILVAIKMNLARQMKILTDCGKWELCLTSSLIHMLNITVWPNV